MPSPDGLAAMAGIELFTYQRKYLEAIRVMPTPQRSCLYYRTGAGKTFTSLAGMRLLGHDQVTVIAPPSTHAQWGELAHKLDMRIQCMSHAKFRMNGTRLSRRMPVIADEFHLFGGAKGMGWRKLDQLARGLQAPLVLMSATPNYNDAERCYCVSHILDPIGTKGGYLQFLYQHCTTEQNHFGIEPIVTGFKAYPDAAAFLAALPGVHHLPDERVVPIKDIAYDPCLPDELLQYGYNRRGHSMVASRIEAQHLARVQGLVDFTGLIREEPMNILLGLLGRPGSVLVYANHATVALALSKTLHEFGIEHLMVTGTTSKANKADAIFDFNMGCNRLMVGTASLATGTDGMDKVCDTLVILDDTDDDALRRQLIGRILPRGDMLSTGGKEVFRLVPA